MNQALSLVEQLKNLAHLQEVDLKIDSIKKNQESLPTGLKAADESMKKIQTLLSTKKNVDAELEKSMKQIQAAWDLNQDRFTRSQSKLEAVQTSQEFQAVNKEIDQLKKLNLSLDEQRKKLSTEREVMIQELAQLEEQLKKLNQERDAQSQVLNGQNRQLRGDLDTLMSERTQFIQGVEGRLLSQYDRIRVARGGIGIVAAFGGRCKGCNMMVPPQLFNELQRGSALHCCPSCSRILYVAGAEQAVSASEPTARHA